MPKLSVDPFSWIPKGLITDLMDNGEPYTVPVNDLVTGYTIAQVFAAMPYDVSSVPQFKAKLVLQNPTNPTNNQINALFASYGY